MAGKRLMYPEQPDELGHYHRKQQGLSVFCSKETGILRCCSLVVVVAAAIVIVVERDTLVSDVCCSRELIFTVAYRKKMLSSVITPARFFVCCVLTHYVDFYSALPRRAFWLARVCRSAIKMMLPSL